MTETGKFAAKQFLLENRTIYTKAEIRLINRHKMRDLLEEKPEHTLCRRVKKQFDAWEKKALKTAKNNVSADNFITLYGS